MGGVLRATTCDANRLAAGNKNMKCFHKTPFPESILKNGFRDGEGTYMTGFMHKGVWLSDRPLKFGQGAKGDDLFLLEIPDNVLAEFEWVEEGKPYREFLIPAEIVNSHGPPKLVDEEDYVW
jgi:hypothetical protein